jgi:hypothetical protein
MRTHVSILLVLVVTACILSAGCTQPPGTDPIQPEVSMTTITTEHPSTPAPTAVPTAVPLVVVTVIHYVSPVKDVKDPDLLFALQVPVEWNVSTHRLMNADTPDYRTDLVGDGVFTILSYPVSRTDAYLKQFREGSPAPNVTTVTINGITFDRFETRAGGITTVAYLAATRSANEHGYASVIVFTARDSSRFEKEDFEKVVSSFRYFSIKAAGTTPGEEIPLFDPSGKALSRKAAGGGSLAWGEWEGENSDFDTTDASPSDEDPSDDEPGGDGGCGCCTG